MAEKKLKPGRKVWRFEQIAINVNVRIDTLAGEREIKKALRKSLFKYKLHADEELFEKAYSYIRQYY